MRLFTRLIFELTCKFWKQAYLNLNAERFFFLRKKLLLIFWFMKEANGLYCKPNEFIRHRPSLFKTNLHALKFYVYVFKGGSSFQVFQPKFWLHVWSFLLWLPYPSHSGFSGLEVACWPLVPKFVGSQKILGTPSFGGEVKPSVPCRSFTACKRSLNVTCKSTFRQNFRTQFHLPPLGALAWWHAWGRLVVKVGTSNPDRTISLEGCSA
jgi:hypothetical protein